MPVMMCTLLSCMRPSCICIKFVTKYIFRILIGFPFQYVLSDYTNVTTPTTLVSNSSIISRGVSMQPSGLFPITARELDIDIWNDKTWCSQMEAMSALLVLCTRNLPATSEPASQGQWRWTCMFFISASDAGDLGRHCAHYGVKVMNRSSKW